MGDSGTGLDTIFFVLPLCLLALVLRRAQGRWLAPGPMFILFWIVWLTLPAIIAPDFPVSDSAVWFLVLLVFCFGLGSILASGSKFAIPDKRTVPLVRTQLLQKFAIAGIVAGVCASILILVANGQSISSVMSVPGLAASASDLTVSRYSGGLSIPFFVPPLLGITYAASFMGTFAARGVESRVWRLIYLVGPVMSASLYATVTTARSGMLTAVCFVFAGWVAERLYRTGEVPKLTRKTVITTTVVIALTGAAFSAIAFLRVGSFDSSARDLLADKMRVYSVGYLGAFSQWWEGGTVPATPEKWGLATFAGADIVPDKEGDYSIAFSDVRQVGPLPQNTTNIFTAWRDIITDFGVVPSLGISALFGWAITRWWRALSLGSTIFTVPFMAGYGYLLHSATLSIYSFTNTSMAVVLGWIVFSVATRPGTSQSQWRRVSQKAHPRLRVEDECLEVS